MNSICFFASYFKGETIPFYIQVYLQELKKYYTEVIFLVSSEKVSDKDSQFLVENKITLQLEKNEGYDFGLWHKAMQKYDILDYDSVAFVNDSSILFCSLGKFFDWSINEKAELLGITESYAVSHHIQSYFLLCKKAILPIVKKYFEKHKIILNLNDVIKTYEIGLSENVLSNGFKIASFVSNNGYKGEFAPYYHCIETHIKQGIPMIKKKIVLQSYRKDELFTLIRMNFNIHTKKYFEEIEQINRNNLLLNLADLTSFEDSSLNVFEIVVYDIKRFIIKQLRCIYKAFK